MKFSFLLLVVKCALLTVSFCFWLLDYDDSCEAETQTIRWTGGESWSWTGGEC